MLSAREIARLALKQNEQILISKFDEVSGLSDTIDEKGNPTLTIYVSSDNTKSLPSEVTVDLPDGSEIEIRTVIIGGLGNPEPQFHQIDSKVIDSLNTTGEHGSICCYVKKEDDPDFIGFVTAGHVFTRRKFIDFDGEIPIDQQRRVVKINGERVGRLVHQKMGYKQDIAIVRLEGEEAIGEQPLRFNQGFYEVDESDEGSAKHNIVAVSSEMRERSGYIIDTGVAMQINYANHPITLYNLCIIGSSSSPHESTTLSIGGDSGGCVYHKQTGRLVGMVIGGNNKFSFVTPLRKHLTNNNYKLY